MPAPKYPFTGITPGNEIGNLAKLADYLVETEGFTAQAAAGVASVVAGESRGNPEAEQSGLSQGVGLIQWTPGSSMKNYGATFPTGNATADFNNQLPAMVKYMKSRSGFDQLKGENNAIAAAGIMSRMEAPAVAGSDERNALIPQILAAMGNPPVGVGGSGGGPLGGGSSGAGPPTATVKFDLFKGPLSFLGGIWHFFSGAPSTIGDIANAIEDINHAIDDVLKWLTWLFSPWNWLRIGAAFVGVIFLGMALFFLYRSVGGPGPGAELSKEAGNAAQLAMVIK